MDVTNSPDTPATATLITITLVAAVGSGSGTAIPADGVVRIVVPVDWSLGVASAMTIDIDVAGTTTTLTSATCSECILVDDQVLTFNLSTGSAVGRLPAPAVAGDTVTITLTNALTMPPTCDNQNGWIWTVKGMSTDGETLHNFLLANPSGDTCKGNAALIFGDPHFHSFSGGTYDVTARAGRIYNIITDRFFQWNSRFVSLSNRGALHTYIGNTALLVNGSRIVCDPVTVEMLVENVKVPQNTRIFLDKEKRFYAKQVVNMMYIKVPGYRIALKAVKIAKGKELPHFDQLVQQLDEGRSDPHGLLGQTSQFTEPVVPTDHNGGGVIEGDFTDYEVPSLFSHAFKFNRYRGPEEPEVIAQEDTGAAH